MFAQDACSSFGHDHSQTSEVCQINVYAPLPHKGKLRVVFGGKICKDAVTCMQVAQSERQKLMK